MAVGEGGEGFGGAEIGGGDVVVEGLEGLLEGVVVTLVVAAGIADVGAGGSSETRPGSRISCWLAWLRWPIQSSLGCSLFQATVAWLPAIS